MSAEPPRARAARRLQGRIAIVTGAGSRPPGDGTGKAISVLFACAGATVAVVDLDEERALATIAEIETLGGDAFAVLGDVASSADSERIVADVLSRCGRLEVLVNNVGIVPPPAPPHEVSDETWDAVLAADLRSVMLMTKHCIPALIAGAGGSIVNIASIGALTSSGATSSYGAAKAGMVRFTADTAVAYGRHGVRANAIAPGHIYTPLVADQDAAAREARRKVAPLGIEGTAWDVAWAALYLAGDEARFVTGACIPVDGGVTQISPLAASRLVAAP